MNSTVPISHNPACRRLAAIVLAAGASSRMGSLKPTLLLAGTTALERAYNLTGAFGQTLYRCHTGLSPRRENGNDRDVRIS
jgi:CTP:molybdopterin cytidylyltransferase MocA